MGQELWLQENKLLAIIELSVQFVARSGMEEAVSSGMLSGRPHGAAVSIFLGLQNCINVYAFY